MFLIFDTETTGLPRSYTAPLSDSDNWPRVVQIAWQLHDENGILLNNRDIIVKPDGFTIPYNAEKIHGISTEKALKLGIPLSEALDIFISDVQKCTYIAGHNIEFDLNIVGAEFIRLGMSNHFEGKETLDTKDLSTDYCAIPGGKGGKYKWPTLEELHKKLFNKGFSEAHNACADVEATTRCFFELCRLNVITAPDISIDQATMDHLAQVAKKILETVSDRDTSESKSSIVKTEEKKISTTELIPFTHLHNHTQFSVLQATTDIGELVKRAAKYNQKAVAITDHGNMYGAFQFWQAVDKYNKGVKSHNEAVEKGEKQEPKKEKLACIIGCELNITKDRNDKKNQSNGYTQVFLAKNKHGYENLMRLSSIGFTEGFYYVPRIDKDILVQYKGGLITTTGSLSAEIPNLILNVGETQAEEAFCWWHEQFGDDFYVELNRHKLPEEDHVNKLLLTWAKKYNVKYFAANSNYYIDKSNATSHDILLCVKDGELKETPIGKGKGYRFGFTNDEFYFKTTEEMNRLFSDLPEALLTTQEIVQKIEEYKLGRDVLLPKFDIPAEFIDPEDEINGTNKGENAYLKHLTYVGAEKKYGEITPDLKERLDFELATIERMGFPGYFLIVQDFTSKAREMGVSVGPGRGSAAGSAIAYCLGITNVDPIKYDLLFERFLNPDRVSMPDIDIDFDDEGRDRVIQYVIDKYGKNQVAQIITYGTMGGKSAIRDTARVLNLPLPDADRLAKTFPANASVSLRKLFGDKGIDDKLKEELKPEELKQAEDFVHLADGTDLTAQTLRQATELEGCVRNTGIHACGVIITPDELVKFVPVAKAKDSELLVTQFDNSVAESAGLLKMDFLGLKTLTIIKDAVRMIKKTKGIDIDPDQIPLDDPKTFELFQRGETKGIFQFESTGMQKYLRDLKPDAFTDLIAMNALYRPGPLAYIPNYVRRKHGQEPIVYDFAVMEEVLKETYGITVYQEQVMRLSQRLANFTKGDADVLRKAMGKKQKDVLDKMKSRFLDGCAENGHDTTIAEKIWKDWEAFASYAFNKSHSTCYAYLAFHTAYLKAHYPAEFMASVLTHNQNNLEDVTFFIEACKSIGIRVLGPHVNESGKFFDVNKNGDIRFGLAAIKGTGEAAVEAIITERDKNGPFVDIFDFAGRVNLRAVNKKTFECLAISGAFDCFEGLHRRQYVFSQEGDISLIEKAIKYSNKVNQEKLSDQVSLFGGAGQSESSPKPKIEPCEPFSDLEKLSLEKELVGLYISGHPLDQFKFEILHLCNTSCKESEETRGKEVLIAGMLTKVEERRDKRGKPFGSFNLQDYSGTISFMMFDEDYLKNRHLMGLGDYIFIRGRNQESKLNPGKWSLRIHHIDHLANIREKLCKGVTLNVDINMISDVMIEDLIDIFGRHPGNQSLRLELIDKEETIQVDTLSRKYRIQASTELINELERIPELSFKVIRAD